MDHCRQVGDAFHQKPARRWLAHYRGDTKNGGPVAWISESHVCPNCVASPGHSCCQAVPPGQFCRADSNNLNHSSPEQLNSGCEAFRFIPGGKA